MLPGTKEAVQMYAIIETGGKQYRVEKGMKLEVEKLPGEPGETHVFDRVLLVGEDGKTRIGTPVVKGAKVSARILEHAKAGKVVVFKMKRRKKSRTRRGHRQLQTSVEITDIKG
jgi:large subunit ribosomal protein L21